MSGVNLSIDDKKCQKEKFASTENIKTVSSLNIYLEFIEGGSIKFYEVSLNGTIVISRYGKSGSAGTTLTKSFNSESEAESFYNKTVVDKKKKGYMELSSDAAIKATTDTKHSKKKKAVATINEIKAVSEASPNETVFLEYIRR